MDRKLTFYEFFAGGGMARAGLADEWECLFANDFSEMKASSYAENWGSEHLVCADIAAVSTSDIPGVADLAWASFPCQDLSLAGKCRGLGKQASKEPTRSGVFWDFCARISDLASEGRAPKSIVLENVVGLTTSNGGRDFAAVCEALWQQNYLFGAVIVDAQHFVPQSRQRLFFIAFSDAVDRIPNALTGASDHWHPAPLRRAYSQLPTELKNNWVWWNMPKPPRRNIGFADLVDDEPELCEWHSVGETKRLLAMMAPLHLKKLEQAQKSGRRHVGGVYKRTRLDAEGNKCQRAEVRFDDVAGCLRTPAGGSSRQLIIVVEGQSIRSRLLAPREAARLMGLEDDYKLPGRYNDAYHIAGDGVCVPVVRYLAQHILEPALATAHSLSSELAA